MAIPKRIHEPGTYFVTSRTFNSRLFQVDRNAELFLETLQHYRREGLYKLHAFVVMPDHIHLLITTEDLPRAMKHIRGGFSHKLASKQEVWQRGYTDHIVPDRDHFETRRRYIHQNPVDEHLCEHPEDYPYSSAYRPSLKSSPED